MALAIRLARGGMKKRPYYRIVVTDARNARDGKFLEKIGTYNPLLNKENPDRVKLDTERAGYWLGVGAQPSDRVARFLDAAGVRTRAARLNPTKGEPGEKAKERAQVAIDKAAEAEAAQVKAAEDAELARLAAEEEATAAAEAAAAEAAAAAAPADEPVAEAAPAPAEEAAAEAPVENAPVDTAPVAVAAETEPEASDAETAIETDATPAGPAV